MHLNSGALVSYYCQPFFLDGEFNCCHRVSQPEDSAFSFSSPKQNRPASSTHGSCYTVVELSVSRNCLGMCLWKASITQSPKSHASLRENCHSKRPKSQFEIDSLCMHEQTCLSKPENPERDRHTYTLVFKKKTIQLSHLLIASFKEIIRAHKTTLDTICAGKNVMVCNSLFIPSLRMRLYLGMTKYATITETGSWYFCNNGTLQ